MKENFPNLVKEIDIQIQEAQSPKKTDSKWPTPRHIIIKMPKIKVRESQMQQKEKEKKKQLVTYRGAPIMLSADFSKESLQARRDWQEISKS